ncbi:MAG: hypothetical protein H6510_07700 [Acidobacteria bacterium]|nr:hypothetical protein [Acidobacteriota bacterium]MCB9397681.1 hypothetical protein [Acidobacteriota bacterium]
MENLYSAPRVHAPAHNHTHATPTASVGRNGKYVVVELSGDNAFLPSRCVKCNEIGVKKSKKMYWLSPGYLFLILVGILVYAIVYYAARQKVMLHYTVCQTHREKKVTLGLLGLASFLAAFVAVVLQWGLIALLCFTAFLVFSIWASRYFGIHKVKGNRVWLFGAGPAFLQHLPPVS